MRIPPGYGFDAGREIYLPKTRYQYDYMKDKLNRLIKEYSSFIKDNKSLKDHQTLSMKYYMVSEYYNFYSDLRLKYFTPNSIKFILED